MADEIGGISVRLDASGTGLDAALSRGEQRVRVFADRTTAALNNPAFNTAGAQAARRIAEALEAEFQAQSSRIQEALRLGLMSPEEAQQAGQDIARQFNKGLTAGVQALGQKTDPGNLALMGVQLKEVGKAADNAGQSAGKASFNFKRLTGSATTLAASVLPVNGAVLRLSTVLGSLALSGGVTVGVLAGASAIAAIWNRMTREARDLKTAAEEAASGIREVWLEELTQGDIRLINQLDPLKRQRDQVVRELNILLRDFEKRGLDLTDPVIRRRAEQVTQLDELERKLADLNEEITKGDTLLADRRALRQEEAREAAEDAAESARRAEEEAEAAAQRRLEAITALVAAGRATAAETEELREAQQRLAAVMRDGTQSVEDRAAAMENLTRITEALTQAQLRQIQLADIGRRGATGRAGIPTAHGDLLPAPRTVAPLGVTLAQSTSGGGLGNLFDMITGNLQAQLLGLPQQMLMSMFGQLQGMITSGLGQLFGSLFGNKPEHGSAEVIRQLERSAEAQREAAEEMRRLNATLQNVPLTFNAEFARTTIGRSVAARTGQPFTVGTVNIIASPTGDSPQSLYRKLKIGLQDAASGGDVLARGLLTAGARG